MTSRRKFLAGSAALDGEAVRREFVRIREHEQTHVKTLQGVNKTAFTSVGKFVSVAQLLENTGVRPTTGPSPT